MALRRLLVPLLAAAALCACRQASAHEGHRPPLIVVGIDGGEWRVIHRLWSERKLPHLKTIADHGVTATLRTAYNSSPVIWTTIATGLILLYFRSTDLVSHNEWKYFEPDGFDPVEPSEMAAHRDLVPRVYEAVDQEIGRILSAAPQGSSVLVMSDHGFHSAHREEIKALVDMDAVLERLGYLARGDGGIDLARTRVYTYGSSGFERVKMLRFALAGREPGGRVRPEERAALRRRLEADLAAVTNDRGEPVLFLRDVYPNRGEDGDFVAVVRLPLVTPVLKVQGRAFPPAVRSLRRISGTHTASTHGIFLAAGPDIDPKADLTGIHVHDVAPTILYALGLPVGKDFAGRARTELFTAGFRRGQPLRTIKSWGTRQETAGARSSKADEDLLNGLRSLGYIR